VGKGVAPAIRHRDCRSKFTEVPVDNRLSLPREDKPNVVGARERSARSLSAPVQSLCVFMAGVRHKSSTLFQPEIARDRGPEALGEIHL